jgi:hypothetical protein
MRFVFALTACLLLAGGTAAEACQGCGCRGGPGYRGPNGSCVGWKQLNKVCGSPPTTRCTAEGPALLATRSFETANVGQAASIGEPVTSNRMRTLVDGVGCVATESLEILRSCVATPAGCEAEQVLFDQNSCVVIPVGTPVTVEASSRSFDWLRVRIPNTTAPVWTERSLILGTE